MNPHESNPPDSAILTTFDLKVYTRLLPFDLDSGVRLWQCSVHKRERSFPSVLISKLVHSGCTLFIAFLCSHTKVANRFFAEKHFNILTLSLFHSEIIYFDPFEFREFKVVENVYTFSVVQMEQHFLFKGAICGKC